MKCGARTSTFACTGSSLPGTIKSTFPDLEAEVTWIAKRWTIGASVIRSTGGACADGIAIRKIEALAAQRGA